MPVDVRNLILPQSQGIAGALGRGLATQQAFQQVGQQNLAAQREAQVREALLGGQQLPPPAGLGAAAQPTPIAQEGMQPTGLGAAIQPPPPPPPTQEEKIRLAREIDPAITNRLLKDFGLDDASKRAEMSRFASDLENTPFAQRRGKIEARIQKLRSEGRDTANTEKLLGMDETAQNQGLLGIQLADLSTKERLTFREKQAAARAKEVKLGGKEVKSSKILDDGTTIQSMKDGTTQVISAAGEALMGDARSEAIKKAQTFAVELQGKRAQQREGGKGAAKIALNAFDQVNKIRSNIGDLREGIRLVREEGAEVGPIADRLPSFRAGARKLENLRSRLGLNVVGAVTFGALSEGELNLAKDVALPKGLSEEETVKWMEDRIEAQQKLSNNLEEAALFLSEPGNTVADFIRFTKQRDKEGQAPAEVPRETPVATPTTSAAVTPTPAQQVLRFNPATGRLE